MPLKYFAKSDSLYYQCLILSSFCCLAFVQENRDALATNRIVETIIGECHMAEPVLSSFCCLAFIQENRDAMVTNRIVETIAGACHTTNPVIQR
jgi:hypothetical protein